MICHINPYYDILCHWGCGPARLCCDAQLVWRFAWPCRLHLALWLLPVALQRPGPFLSILILVQLKRQPVLKTDNENTLAHIFDTTRPCFEVGSACGFQRTRPGATCTKLMHANLIWRLQAMRMPSPPRNWERRCSQAMRSARHRYICNVDVFREWQQSSWLYLLRWPT